MKEERAKFLEDTVVSLIQDILKTKMSKDGKIRSISAIINAYFKQLKFFS